MTNTRRQVAGVREEDEDRILERVVEKIEALQSNEEDTEDIDKDSEEDIEEDKTVMADNNKERSNTRSLFRGIMIMLIVVFYAWNEYVEQSPMITSISPSSVWINKLSTLHIHGNHLENSGIITWVSYWNCAQKGPITNCPKQYPTPIFNEIDKTISVQFSKYDFYIPCYQESTLDTPYCFPHIHLLVKEPKKLE